MPSVSPVIMQSTSGTISQSLTTAFHAPVSQTLTDAINGTYISAIYIHVHAIAAGATTLTLRVSPDSTGDESIIPDTTATIATGYTTANRGSVVYKVDVDAFLASSTLYWTVKTNAGTATLKYITFVYEK